MRFRKHLRLSLLVAMAAVLLSTGRPAANAGIGGNTPTKTANFEELTAKWWQWVFSLPVSENPLFDETGEFANNQQPEKNVFFLVGVINESGTAERSITVPAGTALFFPILNVEFDPLLIDGTQLHGSTTNPKNLAAAAKDNIDSVGTVTATLNGQSLDDSIQRIASPPFAYKLPDEDNIWQAFGVPASGTVAPVVSDGYWVYIPPLAAGSYDLHFGGTIPSINFTLDITYHITVK